MLHYYAESPSEHIDAAPEVVSSNCLLLKEIRNRRKFLRARDRYGNDAADQARFHDGAALRLRIIYKEAVEKIWPAVESAAARQAAKD